MSENENIAQRLERIRNHANNAEEHIALLEKELAESLTNFAKAGAVIDILTMGRNILAEQLAKSETRTPSGLKSTLENWILESGNRSQTRF